MTGGVRRSWKRGLGVLVVCLSIGLSPACGTDQVSAVGIWALRTVDGNELPALLSDDGTTVESISRALLFVEAGMCILNATYIATVDGVPRQPEDVGLACQWEQSGSDVAFGFGSASSATGTLDEPFMTLTYQDGKVWVYERI